MVTVRVTRPGTMARVVIENLLKIFPEKNGPGVRAVNQLSLVV